MKRIIMCKMASFILLIISLYPISAQTPNQFSHLVKYDSLTYTIDFVKDTTRGPYFEVLTQNSSGGFDSYIPKSDIRTYIGTVRETPYGYAAGMILRADSVMQGVIYLKRGYNLHFTADSVIQEMGIENEKITLPSSNTIQSKMIIDSLCIFDVAIDCSYKYYEESDSSFQLIIDRTEYSILQIKAIYLKNLKLLPRLSRVVIRTDEEKCPYDTIYPHTSDVRDEWNIHHSDAKSDVIAMVYSGYGGGLATVNSVGGNYACSINSQDREGYFFRVWRHELGHNWGATDFHANSPEDMTIMCGNKNARFSGPVVQSFFSRRNAVIDSFEMIYGYNKHLLPPMANLDVISSEFGKDSLQINVLANDYDVNSDSIWLVEFDTISALGARICKVDHNNGIVSYIMTDTDSLFDYFKYTIQDIAGKRADGIAIVEFVNKWTCIYEAEDADYSGPRFIESGETSGSGFLDYGASFDDYIEWEIDLDSGGNYTLFFQYALAQNTLTGRPLELMINGQIEDTLDFYGTTSWHLWRAEEYTTNLSKGIHKIRLTAIGYSGSYHDYLKVVRNYTLDIPTKLEEKHEIAELNDEKTILVAVNPYSIQFLSSDNLNQETTAVLYDARGVLITKTSFQQGTASMNTSEIPTGIYFYKIISSQIKQAGSVLLMH